MESKVFLTAGLLFSFSCVFSQIANPCARFSYTFSRELQVPLDAKAISPAFQMDDSVCEKDNVQQIHFKPEIYDWSKLSRRIEDYRNFQYAGNPQDVNGRDLMLDVITNGMIDRLLHRTTPN